MVETAADQHPDATLVDEAMRRITLAGWGANAVGVLVVTASIGFLMPIFLEPGDEGDLLLLNAPLLVACLRRCRVPHRQALRPPARRSTGSPRTGAGRARAPDGAGVGGAGGEGHRARMDRGWLHIRPAQRDRRSWEFAVVAGATAWLGGETTCALVYLISERILRPVTARALAARPPEGRTAPGVRQRLMWAWALGTGVPLLGVIVVGVVGLTRSGSTRSTWRRRSFSWVSWPPPSTCSRRRSRRRRSPTRSLRCEQARIGRAG